MLRSLTVGKCMGGRGLAQRLDKRHIDKRACVACKLLLSLFDCGTADFYSQKRSNAHLNCIIMNVYCQNHHTQGVSYDQNGFFSGQRQLEVPIDDN